MLDTIPDKNIENQDEKIRLKFQQFKKLLLLSCMYKLSKDGVSVFWDYKLDKIMNEILKKTLNDSEFEKG